MTWATLIKGNISLGLTYSFRGSVYHHHAGIMEVSRQTWCWRRNCEFSILILVHPEEILSSAGSQEGVLSTE